MKIEVLGTGGAVGESSTAYLVEDHILVDCGIDIVKKLINENKIQNIDTVFLTHLHMDHVSGFELFVFYLQYVNKEVTVYAGEDFEDFYRQLKCSIDTNKKYYQPFKYINISRETCAEIKENEFYVNIIKAKHMNGSLPCFSFLFFTGFLLEDKTPKILVSGDTDQPLPISASMLHKGNIYLFHDMGLTGVELPDHIYRAHPTEEEVYNVIGSSERVFGIHLPEKCELKHYVKAEKKVYEF